MQLNMPKNQLNNDNEKPNEESEQYTGKQFILKLVVSLSTLIYAIAELLRVINELRN